MIDWYLFSLAALVLLGSQRFLYKVAAAKGCSTPLTTFSFMGTVALLSSLCYIFGQTEIGSLETLVVIALFNSLTFVAATMSHIQALKYLPASLTYPLIRLNTVLVVMFSVIFWGDDLSRSQWTGVVFSLVAMYILSKQVGGNSQDDSFRYKGILLVLLSMVAGALSAISSKFAAVYSNKWAFIALTYTSSTGFTLLLSPFMFSAVQRQSGKECKAVSNGVMMGILNLGGFYLFLEALATGPLSLVASIVGMHFVVAVVLSLCIYKEHLTLWSFGGLVLTVASIFFLRG